VSSPLDFGRLRRTSLRTRKSKVSFRGSGVPPRKGMSFAAFLDGLPDYLAAKDFRAVAAAISRARKRGAPVLLGIGAHFIKVGLSPLLVQAIRDGVFTSVAMNGAGVIHDVELALAGRTSEDVASRLADGSFGMARETAQFLQSALAAGVPAGLGFGASVGKAIDASNAPYRERSLLGQAHRLGVPVTVHVAVGADVVHMHPETDGALIGEGSLRDFRSFCGLVARMDGGAYLNVGSAVILPEVFLKAVSVARNLGRPLARITTVNMDFQRHYRPDVNVVTRPTQAGGRGYHLIGPHEILFPLLMAAVAERG
jgi:deoxyhypusine synthase